MADLSTLSDWQLRARLESHGVKAEASADAVNELPSEWVARCMPSVKLDPYQIEIIDAVATHQRVAARGPRGLGKTMLSSIVVLWFASTREVAGVDWKIVTTSGSWYQLKTFLWREIHKWARRVDWDAVGLPKWRDGEELLKTGIELTHGAASATSPDKPDMIEGAHGDSVLVLFDESKIISTEVFDAVEGIFSNVGNKQGAEGFALAVSTPGPPIGRFYDIHSRKRGTEKWWTRHVTLTECQDAGRIDEDWPQERAEAWGVDSPMYRNHVLGEFAADDENSLIPLAWVEAAMQRWREWDDDGRPNPSGGIRFGVDVARQGSDRSVIARKRGAYITDIETEDYTDNVSELGDRVASMMNATSLSTSACVDADGMGAGTADRMRTVMGDGRVTVFHGGAHDDWTDVSGELRAFNNRSAAWWNLRELLDPALERYGPRLALPPSERLLGDLTAPKRVSDASGKIRVESKDQTKKRLGRSPDEGDAVVYACWTPPPEPPPPTEWVGYAPGNDPGQSSTPKQYKRSRGR